MQERELAERTGTAPTSDPPQPERSPRRAPAGADVADPRLEHPTAARSRASVARALSRSHGNAFVQRARRDARDEGGYERDADAVAERFAREPPAAAGEGDGEERSLPSALRPGLESSVGRSVDAVRIHTGAEAAEAADALEARAFTADDHIYFGAGRYEPESGEGRKLIAHEVAHTVQQREGAPAPQFQSDTDVPPAAPRAGPVSEANLEEMRADVEFIVGKLKQQVLMEAEEQALVDRVAAWAAWDEGHVRSGGAGTPFLDRFLVLLKMRVFSRSTARMLFGLAGDEWLSAYDGLFHELEDERLEQYQRLVARSREGTARAETKQMQSVYGFVGKRVFAGFWGILKNMSTAVTATSDALVWANWRMQGRPGDPPQITAGVAAQFDLAANEMAKAMADGATPEELEREKREIMEEYNFGDRWGTIVGILMSAGMGGSGVGTGLQIVSKAAGIAQGAQAVETAARKINKRIDEIRKVKPGATFSDCLADDEVRLALNEGLVGMIGLVGGVAGVGAGQNAVAQFFSRFGLVFGFANVIPQLQQAWIHYTDPKLTEKERDEALEKDIATIIGTVLATIGGHVDEQRAQAKANAEAGATPATEPTPTPTPEPTPTPTPEVAAPVASVAGSADVQPEPLALKPTQLEPTPLLTPEPPATPVDAPVVPRLGTHEEFGVVPLPESTESLALGERTPGQPAAEMSFQTIDPNAPPPDVLTGADVGTQGRAGEEFHLKNIAETAFGMSTDFDPVRRMARSVEYTQFTSDETLPKRPSEFRIGPDIPPEYQHRHGEYTGTPTERAHGAGREAFASYPEALRDIDVISNIWPAAGRGEQGVNRGPMRRLEILAARQAAADPAGFVRVKVEAIFDPNVPPSPPGAQINSAEILGFTRYHWSSSGELLTAQTILNR